MHLSLCSPNVKDDSTVIMRAATTRVCVCARACDSSWSQQPVGAGSAFPISLEGNWSSVDQLPQGCGRGTVLPGWPLTASASFPAAQRLGASGDRNVGTEIYQRQPITCGRGQSLCPEPAVSLLTHPGVRIQPWLWSLLFHPQLALHVQTQHFLAGFRRMKQSSRYSISGYMNDKK